MYIYILIYLYIYVYNYVPIQGELSSILCPMRIECRMRSHGNEMMLTQKGRGDHQGSREEICSGGNRVCSTQDVLVG